MAGGLTISTLNNDTGVLATQNGMTGIPKAWVNFNGTNASIRGSFNVSSVTRNGTGDYTINFTTSMPNANYCATISSSLSSDNLMELVSQVATTSSSSQSAPTTSSIRCAMSKSGVGFRDAPFVMLAIFSS